MRQLLGEVMWNYLKAGLCAAAILALQTGYAGAEAKPGSFEQSQLKKIIADPDNFVEGSLYFIGYHEMGHALISEFGLPVVGREEDAVDRLAVILMTPEKDKGQPEYLIGAMQGWFQTATETPLNELDWWDEHGTDLQRGYQIACLLYGADEARFAKIGKVLDISEESAEKCVDESAQNMSAWASLLEPHETSEEDGDPKPVATVTYEPSKEYDEQITYLKRLGLLEDIADLMRTNYKFDGGIKITGRTCDEPNAFWDGSARELTYCYELVKEFQYLSEK
jgi:hypothetical protein